MKIDSFELLPIYDENFNIYIDGATVTDNRITLKKGDYDLQLTFDISRENQGDTLALYINNSLFSCINIPTNKEVDFNTILTLNIDKDDTILSFINESDDFITMENLMGGLFMSEQLQIINVENFNPFSLNLELSVPFTDDISVKVTELNLDPGSTPKEMNTKIVDTLNLKNPSKSTAGNPNLKTVIVPGGINDSNELFKVNTPYRITVFNEVENFTDIYSFNFTTFTMMNENNCTVRSVGTRIIAIEFDYPVRNLDAIVKDTTHEPQHTELNNFYIAYNGMDTNMGEDENLWLGNMDVERIYTTGGVETKVYPFTATVSEDKRRVEIQCNSTNFNTGSVNKISINFTKHQDSNKELTDFSNRPIAIFEKAFSFSRNIIATEITDIRANSNHEIEVTFQDSVCIRTIGTEDLPTDYFTISKVIDPSTSIDLNIQDVSRVGNGFNQLLYLLNTDDISNLLDIPQCTIKVGNVLDASGLDTLAVQRTIPVPLTNPTFEDAYQDGDNAGDKTRIIAVFNEPMERTINTGENSATNPLNYILQKGLTGLPIPIESIVSQGVPDGYQFIITINSVLPTGEYFLTALGNIKDITGVNITTKQLKVDIIDYTSPEIERIIATKPVGAIGTLNDKDNAFVIMFKQPMNVLLGSTTSALRQGNYRLTYEEPVGTFTPYSLDATTSTAEIFENKWIRYTLPTTTPPGMPDFNVDKYKIFIGYVNGPELNYVTSESGNIYPLCTPGEIDYLVDKLDIAKGTATITSTNTIEYKLNSSLSDATIINNLFYNVSASDFQAIFVDSTTSANNIAKEPISYVLDQINFNKIIFTFPDDTFTSITTNVKLVSKYIDVTTLYTISTMDIFGKGILRSAVAYDTITPATTGVGLIAATNQIPTSIQGIGSLLNIDTTNKTADIQLNFGKDIIATSKNDFTVYYKDPITSLKQYLAIGGANHSEIAPNGTNPVTLTNIVLPNVSYTVIDNLFVSTVPDPYPSFTTKDSNGNFIAQFSDLPVGMLSVQNFEWNYVPAVIGVGDKYQLILTFNKPINTQYAGIPLPTTVPVANPPYVVTATGTDGSDIITVNIGDIANPVKLGQFDLQFASSFITAPILTWQAESIALSPDAYIMTIVLQNTTTTDDLFATPVTPTAAVTKYMPVATTVAYSAAIVDAADTIRLDIVDKAVDVIS